jgi:hypothetical protein
MKKVSPNKKPPYLLMYIVTLVFLVVTAFFEEGVAYFDPVYTTLMSSTEFYLTFSLCLVLFLTVIYIAKHYFGIKINWVFFSLVALLFMVDLVSILSFPEWTVLTGVYHVTVSLRLRYITFWLAACMAFYVFFAIMPKSVRNVNDWNFYFLGGIFITVVACVYSYIHEWNSYVSFFGESVNFLNYEGPVSFTNNKNTFATLLLIGTFCSFYLFAKTRKIIFPFLGLIFSVNTIFTFGKTAILCTAVFLIAFVFLDYLVSVKRHPIIRTFLLVLFISCLLFPLLVKPLGLVSKNVFFSRMDSYLKEIIDVQMPHSLLFITSRVDIWTDLLDVLFSKPQFVLFGFGDWNFSWFLGFVRSGNYAYIESSHSGFLDVFSRLGLLGCIFYCGLLVYFIVLIFKSPKKDWFFSGVSFSIFICTLLHGFFEDTNYLNMQAKPMMLLFIAYMPILTNSFLLRRHRSVEPWEQQYSSGSGLRSDKQLSPLLAMEMVLFVFVPVFSTVIGCSEFFSFWNGAAVADRPLFQAQLIVCFLCLPLCVYAAFCQKRFGRKTRFITCLTFALSCFITFSGLSFLYSNLAFFIIVVFVELALLFYGFFGIPNAEILSFLPVFLPYCFVGSALTICNKTIVHFCLVFNGVYQPYAIMCLGILGFLIMVCLSLIIRQFRRSNDEMSRKWMMIEEIYCFTCYRYSVKREIRLMRTIQKKPVLRLQE